MAKALNFPASDSQDVVEYIFYIEEAPNEVTTSSESVSLGNPTPDDNGVISVELDTISILTTKDGIYNIAVGAVDDAGLPSSLSKLSDVSLDFVAPNPPGTLSIVEL